jgi:hypothetical protein
MESSTIYIPPNTIRIIKSRRMKCTGNATFMCELRDSLIVLVGKPNPSLKIDFRKRRNLFSCVMISWMRYHAVLGSL